ncbi:putative mitochondrial protein [Senna tora]|uniref:Putative mitochondrial protein n=1 Tax=Senna tora TaxID=362788 RepID=A0A834X8Q8_9FABA|nr:putative mitochondrial protein [Senna tora]
MADQTPISETSGDRSSKTGGSSETAINLYRRRDPYYIHPSDNSGAQIVVNLLTLSNYLVWSRAVRIALKTKNKLGFIDRTIVSPEDTTSEEFMKWSDADSLVLSWLLHSMTKDLMEAYMFTPTSRDLWLELEEKFGTSDRSQIYDLRKQLIQIVQGTDSLALYSNKQKKLIDELNCLDPKSPCVCNGCTCGGYKKLVDSVTNNDTYCFLRGLDESYNSIVSTILLMDPLPSYNKVYSLVNRIEGQKNGGSSTNNAVEASALVAKVTEQLKRHLEEACFKKHGYPEWYKEYKLRRSSQNPTLAVTGGGPTSESKQKGDESNFNSALIAQMVQLEVQKLMKNKNAVEESPVNTSYFADFAVTLPDGSVKIVTSIGSADISDSLKLDSVLFVPDFKYNLISVGKLVCDSSVQVHFHSSGCIVQDLLTIIKDSDGSDTWHNRLGHPSNEVLNWKCPFEVLMNKVPKYSLMKVFGCLAYATNTSPHKTKFDPRAKKCMFVGYATDCRGYKMFDLEEDDLFDSGKDLDQPVKSVSSDIVPAAASPIVSDPSPVHG